MDITSFWAQKVTESEPLLVRVPRDQQLHVSQITLGEPAANTTSLWVTSSYDSNYTESDSDRESIEESSDSEDEDSLKVKCGPVAAGHLTWGRQETLRTRLVFGGGEKVRFTVVGDGEIHLIGNMTVEDLSFLRDADSDDDSDYDDYSHAVVLSRDGEPIHIAAEDEDDEEEEEYEEVDSDDEELEIDDDEDDDSDDEEMMDAQDVILEGPFIEELGTDSDDDEEEQRLDAREIRRLLLGEDAGDRPDSDDDEEDEEFDEDAFYAALAKDDIRDDGEEADEMDIVDEAPSRKKRGRAGEFDAEFSSPNGKKHKRQEFTNGESRHHSRKNHGKKHRRN